MSAFMVSNETIADVVEVLNSYSMHGRGEHEWDVKLSSKQKAELGNKLYVANTNAVNGRYNENAEAPVWGECAASYAKVQLYKSLQCYLYQCAESGLTPEDEALIAEVEEAGAKLAHCIVSATAAYENAEWDR